jgi:hypothetical protein
LDIFPSSQVSGFVGLAVAVFILPAASYDVWRTQRRSRRTLICDKCGVVKSLDGQPKCACGGHYEPLAAMKWVEPAAVLSIGRQPSAN